MKRIPLRKCVATNEQLPKNELIRVVKTPENTVEIDLTGKKNGRGAYIKKNVDAISLSRKTNALGRSLSIEIPNEVYEELLKIINE